MVKLSDLPSAGVVNNNFIYPLTDPSDTSSAPSGTTKSSTPVVMAPAIQSNLSDALKSIGALTPAADRVPYYTGAASASLTALTSFGRSLIAAGDADTAKTALGLAGLATTGITGTLTLTKAGTTARTVTFPDAAGTAAFIDLAQTWTASQTFADVVINTGNNLTMTGGVITDSTGTITLDDATQVNGTLTASGAITAAAGTDLTSTIGRSAIGAYISNVAYWSHVTNTNATDYAIFQTTLGATAINAKTGQTLRLRNNNADIVTISSSVVTFSSGINLTLNGGVIADASGNLVIQQTTTELYRSASAVSSGVVLSFVLNDNVGAKNTYASLAAIITDSAAGSEDGYLSLRSCGSGTLAERARVESGQVLLASGIDLTLNGGVIADSTGTITLDDNVNINGRVLTTGTTSSSEIRNGLLTVILGADSATSTLTNSTTKAARIGCPHYLTAEEPLAVLLIQGTPTQNIIDWGGGTSLQNIATSHQFHVSANNTTTGSSVRMTLNNTGLSLASGVNLTLNGGVIADSTGTITLDDDLQFGTTFVLSPNASGQYLDVTSGDAANSFLKFFTTGFEIGTIGFGSTGFRILDSGGITSNLTVSNTAVILRNSSDLQMRGGAITDTLTDIVEFGDVIQLFSSAGAASSADTLKIDSTQKAFSGYTAGVAGELLRKLASGYSARTQTGIVANATLVPALIDGTVTMPANYFVPGRVIRYRLAGYYTTDVAPGNATVRILIGGTVFRTTGSFALDASITNGVWVLEGCITCYSTGATGQFQGTMYWQHRQAGAGGTPLHVQEATSVAAVSIDTTAAQTIGFDWTATDSGTSITCTCFLLEEA